MGEIHSSVAIAVVQRPKREGAIQEYSLVIAPTAISGNVVNLSSDFRQRMLFHDISEAVDLFHTLRGDFELSFQSNPWARRPRQPEKRGEKAHVQLCAV